MFATKVPGGHIMLCRVLATVSALALTLGSVGCSRDATVDRRDSALAKDAAPELDRPAQLRQMRERDLSAMDDRIASLDRKYLEYQDKSAANPRGTSGAAATPILHDDVKSEMKAVREAVSGLRTTTPENWWERHESALKAAADDVEADVKRFAGARALPAAPKSPRVAPDSSGQPVSTAPFTSSRDKFVGDMRMRLDTIDKTLDNVKATGPRKTELDDLRARVHKLGEDIDRLKSASAEDWWDISKTRVADYIDRVEKSVARLDDHKQ
jgi:hypothetical protein